jgi:hypothetical protein
MDPLYAAAVIASPASLLNEGKRQAYRLTRLPQLKSRTGKALFGVPLPLKAFVLDETDNLRRRGYLYAALGYALKPFHRDLLQLYGEYFHSLSETLYCLRLPYGSQHELMCYPRTRRIRRTV